jgi:hypothetical protein
MIRGDKRGQTKISFGMIVAIILIVVFISVAFYAISKFIGLQKNIEVSNFADDLQIDVDKLWKSQGSQEVEYRIPSKIREVCFVDFNSPKLGRDIDKYQELNRAFYGDENLVFFPFGSAEGLNSKVIEHIDLNLITEDHNPFCLDNDNGVKMTISRDFGDSLVTITG